MLHISLSQMLSRLHNRILDSRTEMSSSTDDDGGTALAPLPDIQAQTSIPRRRGYSLGGCKHCRSTVSRTVLYRSANLRAATIPRATILRFGTKRLFRLGTKHARHRRQHPPLFARAAPSLPASPSPPSVFPGPDLPSFDEFVAASLFDQSDQSIV